MSTRSRIFLESIVTAAVAILLAFGLLWLLHARLDAWRGFDLAFQSTVHRWTSPALTITMRLLSIIGSTECFVPALLLVYGVQVYREHPEARRTALVFIGGMGGAILLNDSFKAFFHRVRPAEGWGLAQEKTFSYPSGHAIFALVLYGLIAWAILRRGRTAPRLLAALVVFLMVPATGVSRIYLGVHWPTDVLGGYLVGACWLTATLKIERRYLATD